MKSNRLFQVVIFILFMLGAIFLMLGVPCVVTGDQFERSFGAALSVIGAVMLVPILNDLNNCA